MQIKYIYFFILLKLLNCETLNKIKSVKLDEFDLQVFAKHTGLDEFDFEYAELDDEVEHAELDDEPVELADENEINGIKKRVIYIKNTIDMMKRKNII
jgi:hypothetical protein